MKENYLPQIAELRALVGYLGERQQYHWWSTAFCDPSSRPFLEPVFSKTSRLAQYYGVVEAARRMHDEHLNVGCYHLFRLPAEVEQDLYEFARSESTEKASTHELQNKEQAIDKLEKLAGAAQLSGVGPLSIGSVGELHNSKIIQTIAAAYLSAFKSNVKTFPYMTNRA